MTLTEEQKKQLIIEAQFYADGLKKAGRKEFSEVEYAEEDFIAGAKKYFIALNGKDEEIARLRSALQRLCALKAYKTFNGKDSHYETEQPLAWEQATEALKQ